MTGFSFESYESTPSSQRLTAELLALEQSLAFSRVADEFEDLSHIKRALNQKYLQMYVDLKNIGIVGNGTEQAVQQVLQDKLNVLNDEERYFNTDDLLSFSGNLYSFVTPTEAENARQDNEEDKAPGFVRFGEHEKIRGIYSNLTVLEAPTNKELFRRLTWPADYDANTPQRMLAAPAIRILCPVVIRYDETGETYSEINDFASMEIPLTYKSCHIERAA